MFVDNLSVAEEEGDRFVFDTADHKDFLDILTPCPHGVVLDDLYLEELVVGDEGGHFSERLPAASSNAEKQGIAGRLPDDSCDSSDMFRRIEEHDQFHGFATTVDDEGGV